ncbi:NTPase [Cordyceps fumosorosea ARSEF 2679]|uniref:inosine/xanthosine triphosphatase n=1 Tax=Cordyceps fumosorosea (strain ARSEF 2679) TaxID=1081104 RepID=A0A168EUR9_CORFA|nr:NTPase [Cordyceps fumosorosea ARSEF 2679]OAA74253.1 NTPase [Cordyceps fumosorosea ARSEF 2679]
MVPAIGRNVIVASKNPLKLQATRDGFARIFPDNSFAFQGRSVASNVADQPLSDDETLRGALNRARNARTLEPAAAYWVGLEGGVHPEGGDGDEVQSFAWIVVLGRDGEIGRARTATFFLPRETVRLMREEGLELGEADNRLHGRTDSKHETGTVGILTGDVVTRRSYYAEAVVLALIPFRNAQLTFGKERDDEGELELAALDGKE